MMTRLPYTAPTIRWPRPVYVASFPPRECGIATFTRDLVTAIDRLGTATEGAVVAMNDPGGNYAYPRSVVCQVERDDPGSYLRAARFINSAGYDVLNVQHEYGLFGGTWGDDLFGLLDSARCPAVVTMHTTLPDPEPALRSVTRELIERSTATVVLARTAIDILVRDYGVDPAKLHFIPHGVPNVRPIAASAAKRALGIAGRPVLATCGLMNPGKGIEYAIEAVAALVAEFPNVLYVVAGETHPGVRAQAGERYREELEAQVRRHGLERNVVFHNRYLAYRELVLHLLASDVYVVPYLNLSQIVSGTLAYAVGCGRAVVSTASLYARELLADGVGLLAEARDPQSLASRIAAILRNPDYQRQLQGRAYARGHQMIWPSVAASYLDVFRAAAGAPTQGPLAAPTFPTGVQVLSA
jgi:glycosyltransferase involved in cell wall biosynthesis